METAPPADAAAATTDGDFAALVAHELRQPLHKVATFCALLAERIGDGDEESARYMARIGAGVTHLQRLIDALLALAATGTRLERHTTDLTEVARSAIADLDEPITAAAASVTVSDLPTIDAEPTLMRQLFANLVSNSLRFRHPDRPLRVGIEASAEETGWCRLVVHDNGMGLPASDAERAFRPFERLDRAGEGLGLGLTIARAIVAAHGGSITAEESPGGGTTFIVRLPAPA